MGRVALDLGGSVDLKRSGGLVAVPKSVYGRLRALSRERLISVSVLTRAALFYLLENYEEVTEAYKRTLDDEGFGLEPVSVVKRKKAANDR